VDPGAPSPRLKDDDRPAAFPLDGIDACIFGLEDVLIDAVHLHVRAWKRALDSYFALGGIPGDARPIAPATDEELRRVVDPDLGEEAVRGVLADRGLLGEGGAVARVADQALARMASEEDRHFGKLLEIEDLKPFCTSVELLRSFQERGVAVAVVSSSRHCAQMLRRAGLDDLVDVRVDGETASSMGLALPPDPSMLLEAVARVGASPCRAGIIAAQPFEVDAGRRGGFATVLGVARRHRSDALEEAGADTVVDDLSDLTLSGTGPSQSRWQFGYGPLAAEQQGAAETLCTLANGYVGTRGAPPWAHGDGTSYPGTYVAGVFNRLDSTVDGRTMETESLVKVPSWLPVTFRIAGGPWMPDGFTTESADLRLDLRRGMLVRHCVVVDQWGRRTAIIERRVASMAHPHLLAAEISLVPLDWSGVLEIRSGIEGRVVNDETLEDRLLANRHLRTVDQGSSIGDVLWIRSRTVQSEVIVAIAARTRSSGWSGGIHRDLDDYASYPTQRISAPVVAGSRVVVEKVAAVFTSRDNAISEPGLAARALAANAPDFDAIVASHELAWERMWQAAEVTLVDGEESARTITLHLFHLLQVASPYVAGLDTGVGARGLHGEGYRGHVFWDTIFMSPVLATCFPAVSRSLLAYRGRRLDAARAAAATLGCTGAVFPWQSGSDGRDETPSVLFNPLSGQWMPDRSKLQRHVGLALAYEAWQHWQLSGNLEFIGGLGASLIIEIARFFSDLARFDPDLGRYRIAGVMGPDEFHDGYPWSDEPGLVDNAYTNVMVAWLLRTTTDLVAVLEDAHATGVLEVLGLEQSELSRWKEVSNTLHIPFHDGVVSQFAGYERLEPIDLDAYRERYGNIGRLDLIMNAEKDAVNRYQVSKQADVLMLFYLLSAEELRSVLEPMGYRLEPDTIRRTVNYYASRVTHGSTLSKVVHSWVFSRADRESSWRFFQDALRADTADTQGGTTREGIHLGAMAGTVDILRRCYTGLEVRDEALWLNPVLPAELHSLGMRLSFRGHSVSLLIDHDHLRVESEGGRAGPAKLMLRGTSEILHRGQVVEVNLR